MKLEMSACPLKLMLILPNITQYIEIMFGIELKVNGDIVSILHVHCSLQQDQYSFEIND